jgi:hypothetical protein
MGSIDEYNQKTKISRYCPFKLVYFFIVFPVSALLFPLNPSVNRFGI